MDESEKTELNRIPDEKGRMVFPKGVSGNPNGRPKGSFSLVELIKKKLQEQAEIEGVKVDKTYADMFINKLIVKAVKDGDTTLMRDMIDRVDGKPNQSIDMKATVKNIELSQAEKDELLKLI